MTERDRDQVELRESKAAVAAARAASLQTDEILQTVRKTSAEITSAVQPNGYVNRFRKMLRGA